MQKFSLVFFTVLLVIIACSKKIETQSSTNLPPSDFTISIDELKPNAAKLTWTPARDPEGKEIKYMVILDNDTLKKNSTNTQIELINLIENKLYKLTVIASDPEGAVSKQSITFTSILLNIPTAFEITLTHIGGSIASVKWTRSSIADNTPIKYDFYLNDSLIRENLTDTVTNFNLTKLKEFTTYNVKIIAKSIYNKTKIIEKQFVTIADPSPINLGLQMKVVSYSLLKFVIDSAIDIEGQNIKYKVFLDNVEVSSQLEPTIIANKEYTLRNLIELRNYVLKVVAIDEADKSINVVNTIVTLKKPSIPITTKTFTRTATGYIYNLLTNVNYKPSKINMYANGVLIATPPTSINVIGANTISYTYPLSIFTAEGNYSIAANLFWGDDTELSNTATFNNYLFYTPTPTSVSVSEAKIDAASSEKPYTIFFLNGIISPFSSFQIIEVVFGEYNVPFTIFGTGPSTGYLTQFTSSLFPLINAGPRTGYVLMKDAAGYHKLNFIFSYW
jgi:hypothetical protein